MFPKFFRYLRSLRFLQDEAIILLYLRHRKSPPYVTQIERELGMKNMTVSKKLSNLKSHGMIIDNKGDRFRYILLTGVGKSLTNYFPKKFYDNMMMLYSMSLKKQIPRIR